MISLAVFDSATDCEHAISSYNDIEHDGSCILNKFFDKFVLLVTVCWCID